MAAEQHFNNFMIVVSGSHKERERKIEGSRRERVCACVCAQSVRGGGGEYATETVHPD